MIWRKQDLPHRRFALMQTDQAVWRPGMTFPLFDLTGKRALVTGSSQGIGLTLARGLAEHGASVVINGCDANKASRRGRRGVCRIPA